MFSGCELGHKGVVFLSNPLTVVKAMTIWKDYRQTHERIRSNGA